jgi:hypothetical protein
MRLQKMVPWYANGTLNEKEMAEFSAHLEVCERCRDDLESTVDQMRRLNAASLPHSGADAGLSKLKARIAGHDDVGPAKRSVPSYVPAVLSLATLILAGVVALTPYEPETFQALTSHSTKPVVQIAFSDGADEQTLRRIVLDSGGVLVGNPSRHGIYRLAFDSNDEASRTLDRLEHSEWVRWASLEHP